ncbi:Xenotropic and polytropic retrovirus receptor 1-like [Hondaea fermentalgiana]|uniref:Xenotropic and polytropic retrovirus receptor 1-like n=1 Tax=Hondaea fermentalgiana TaxID=2315210 RepID=A0A2R5G3M4_9STRA|nr:Xenotropic and polytropic retrovirus receptor 1-like [Hondaea fermentalgiana]|eukprot:GBG25610.1 Xenotropic and polytropic retrovirus receptor 1-like [Hondaea fermentalgiana]
MKFGKHLQEEAVLGWRYVDYIGLKQLLKSIVDKGAAARKPRQVNSFAQQLAEELKAVEAFFIEKQAEARRELERLQNDLYVCEGWVESNYPDTDDHLEGIVQGFTDLGLVVAKLLHYLELNVTATRKIVKKYSHVTGHHAGPSLLSGAGALEFERLSDPYELTEIVIAVQAGLERSRVLRSALRGRREARRSVRQSPYAGADATSKGASGYGTVPRKGYASPGGVEGVINEEALDSDSDGAEIPDKIKLGAVHGLEESNPMLRRHSSNASDASNSNDDQSSLRFRRFLASQLLISNATHKRLAAELELSRARVNRKPRHEYFHNLTQAFTQGKNQESGTAEGAAKTRAMRQDRRNQTALIVGVLMLALLYSMNLGSLAPYNLFYAEVTATPIGSSAFSFAAIRLCSWVCAFAVASLSRRGFFSVVIASAVALTLGNLLYASVFSTYFEYGPEGVAGQPGDPQIIEDRAAHTDVMLLAGFFMIGTGGFLINVLPALACGRPTIVLSRCVEKLAATAFATAVLGELIGRAVSACTTSWDFGKETRFHSLLINGLSLPALVLSGLWLAVLASLVVPWLLRGLYRACCVPARAPLTSTEEDEVHPLYAGISSILSANYLKRLDVTSVYGGATAKASVPVPDWTFGLALQGCSAFAQAIVFGVTIVNLQMVFSAAWPVVSLVSLAWSAVVFPSLYATTLAIRFAGAWLVLRMSLVVSVFLACFLLPLDGIGTTYTFARFLSLSIALQIFLVALRSVSNYGMCRLAERGADEAPLPQYGLLGPLLAVEASRYCGEVAAYTLLGIALRETVFDPSAVLNYAFGAVALLLGTCLLAIAGH